MTAPVYRFRHGEPIVIGREVLSGDPAGYSVEAQMKPTVGQAVPSPEVPAIAAFAVSFQAAAPGQAARWVMAISSIQAAAYGIEPGRYAVDARFLLAGEVVAVSEPAFIVIERSVSA